MKTILITGAARRLGALISQYFIKQGYNIALHYNQSHDAAQDLIKNYDQQQVKLYSKDLGQRDAISQLITEVTADFGNIDVLINNASIFAPSKFMASDLKELSAYLNIHLIAPYFLIQDYVSLGNKGHVINITDTRVNKNKTRYFPYLLSKKSLSNLTEMLAVELAPDVKVNEIAPGRVLPSKENIKDADADIYQEKLPAKQFADPNQIIKAINYIISNDPIGQRFFIDGGEFLNG